MSTLSELLGGGGGGAWELITTVTGSNVSTIDIEPTFSTDHVMYMLVGEGIKSATNGENLYMRFKMGGSYLTTGYTFNNIYRTEQTGSSAYDSNGTKMQITRNGGDAAVSNASYSTGLFIGYIANPTSTSNAKIISGTFANTPEDGATHLAYYTFAGQQDPSVSTAAVQGIRFYMSAGNLYGTFKVYGLKAS